MANAKRRRGIGVKKWILEALKDAVEKGGHKTPTELANKIWRGDTAPIEDAKRFKREGLQGSKGVSMREELWLALKVYAEERGKGESSQKVANMILVGRIPPLPHQCVARGSDWAREREQERIAKQLLEKEEPKEKEEAPPREERNPPKHMRSRRPSHGTKREASNETESKKINPDADYFGGTFYL